MNDIWVGFEGDSQGTEVTQVAIGEFDFERWNEHEASGIDARREFISAKEGVLFHRRFRVPRIFSWGCADMEESLKWQLGALQASMDYTMDIPNFLEPWYGIGTVASCFGAEYEWSTGQAPAVHPPFSSVEDALAYEPVSVEQTAIGKRTLEMMEFFLEKTKGRLPVSFTDTQSPLDIAASLVNTTAFLLGLYDNPEGVKELIQRTVSLNVEFTEKQRKLIGDALVSPGHGFASCREFTGLGMSDDTSTMMSPDQFNQFVCPSIAETGKPFGGAVYHSCGNWAPRLQYVLGIEGLVTVDAAFTVETDPDPNSADVFSDAMADSGIVLNARCAGSPKRIEDTVNKLAIRGMKTIIVTYARNPEEQKEIIHNFRS